MPVTELALLHLKSDLSPILTKLKAAATKQAAFSGHPVTLLRCFEEPDVIYLVGGWDSVAQHMEEWIPGPINQGLMGELKEDVNVRWMFHVGVGTGEVKRVLGKVVGDGDGKGEDKGSGVVAVGRYLVVDRKGFEAAYQEGVDGLERRVTGGKEGLAGGWREDVGFEADTRKKEENEGDLNEFVLFTAWGSVQEHLDFAKTEEFERWARIKDFMSGAEIRHGRVLFVAEP